MEKFNFLCKNGTVFESYSEDVVDDINEKVLKQEFRTFKMLEENETIGILTILSGGTQNKSSIIYYTWQDAYAALVEMRTYTTNNCRYFSYIIRSMPAFENMAELDEWNEKLQNQINILKDVEEFIQNKEGLIYEK